MPLSIKQIKFLRQLAHSLKPVVIVGQHGLTDNVQHEIDRALEHHELVKLRVNADDRQQREQMIRDLAKRHRAEPVQRIGHIAVFYRRNRDKPKIDLPRH